MEKGILCLSFDDGRCDNLDVFHEMLIPRNIPITINITTGYVDGSCPKELCPSIKPAMTVENIKQLYKQPSVEIALHGDKHLNTVEDISEGERKIKKWLNISQETPLGFASPKSKFDIKSIEEAETSFFSTQLRYVRTGLRIKQNRFIKVCARKVGRVIHFPFLYSIAYSDSMMNDVRETGNVIYSVSVLNDITFGQVRALVDACIKQKKILILQFHSIVDDAKHDDNWSWDKKKFELLCDYIVKKREQGSLDLCRTIDLCN